MPTMTPHEKHFRREARIYGGYVRTDLMHLRSSMARAFDWRETAAQVERRHVDAHEAVSYLHRRADVSERIADRYQQQLVRSAVRAAHYAGLALAEAAMRRSGKVA